MSSQTQTRFDAAALRGGYESRNPDALRPLYADDAEITLVDKNDTPSAPRVVRGRQEVDAHLDDVLGRDMTHDVEHVLVDGDTVAYRVACGYPDGTRVVCMSIAELRDGRIAREKIIQAWDE